MSLILAIHQVCAVWKYLRYIVVVEHVDSLVICECVIQYIHDNARVIHHSETVDDRVEIALLPVIQNHTDTIHATIYHTYHCRVLLHQLIDDFKIFFLLLLCWLSEAIEVNAKRLILGSLYIGGSVRITHLYISIPRIRLLVVDRNLLISHLERLL